MSVTISHSSAFETSLPLPRLVLRLGGLGNRYFGSANGIAEQPDKISAAISEAVTAVLNHIETTLRSLHDTDQTTSDHHWPEPLSGWKVWKKLPGLIMGSKDRWGVKSLRDNPCPVFTGQLPLVTLMTGGAEGADTILDTITQDRSSKFGVEYRGLHIKPESPANVPDGLGIGSIPKKLPESHAQTTEGMPRTEAKERAVIARQRAYGFRAQSEALRHHSDILIAVWDPHTEGKAGGTSESVAAALNERIPVIAVRVLGEEHCEIRVLFSPEHLWAQQGVATADARPNEDWQGDLTRILTNILQFPDPSPNSDEHLEPNDTTYHPRAAFQAFREGRPLNRIWTARLWSVYEAFSKYRSACHARNMVHHESGHITTEETARLTKEHQTSWNNLRDALVGLFKSKEAAALSERSPTELQQPTYASWYKRVRERAASSGMSGVFGDAHRGGILASYLFAAIAVLLAVLGGLLHYQNYHPGFLITCAVGELVVIILMYSISEASKIEDWNTAYTESRILAEALRMMEHLGPLGVHTPLPRLPYYLRGAKETPEPGRMWSVWYFRALVRMAPIRLNPAASLSLGEHRKTLEKLVADQRSYHQKNAARQMAIHHDIEWFSMVLFLLVLLCVTLHIADIVNGWHTFAAIGLIVCVGAPSLIAALHGLASQIEIARLHQRSSSVAELLLQQYRRIDHLDFSKSSDSAESVWGYTTEVLSTASLLMDETAGWSMLYRNSDIHAG